MFQIRILSHSISSHLNPCRLISSLVHDRFSVLFFSLESSALSCPFHTLVPSFNPLSSSGSTSPRTALAITLQTFILHPPSSILHPGAPSSCSLSPISLDIHSPDLRRESRVETFSLKKRGTYRCSPVHNCLKFSDVLSSSAPSRTQLNDL